MYIVSHFQFECSECCELFSITNCEWVYLFCLARSLCSNVCFATRLKNHDIHFHFFENSNCNSFSEPFPIFSFKYFVLISNDGVAVVQSAEKCHEESDYESKSLCAMSEEYFCVTRHHATKNYNLFRTLFSLLLLHRWTDARSDCHIDFCMKNSQIVLARTLASPFSPHISTSSCCAKQLNPIVKIFFTYFTYSAATALATINVRKEKERVETRTSAQNQWIII